MTVTRTATSAVHQTMTSTSGIAPQIALITEIALGMGLMERTVTEMYEELVAKLRDHNACISIKTLDEAADVIEELSAHYCPHAIRNVHDRGDDSLCRVLMREVPKGE